jgi:hypothetical protein
MRGTPMATIRIRPRVESDALTLPELKPLVGKTVDIEVTERQDTPPEDRWAMAADAVRQLTDYDFDAAADCDSGQ